MEQIILQTFYAPQYGCFKKRLEKNYSDNSPFYTTWHEVISFPMT